jgi:hypothetical protein
VAPESRLHLLSSPATSLPEGAMTLINQPVHHDMSTVGTTFFQIELYKQSNASRAIANPVRNRPWIRTHSIDHFYCLGLLQMAMFSAIRDDAQRHELVGVPLRQ